MVQLKILEPLILYLKSTSTSGLYRYWCDTNVEYRIENLVKPYPIVGKLLFSEDQGPGFRDKTNIKFCQ